MDQVAHLKYLQTVLKEFDAKTTPTDELIIYYFWDGLKLSTQSHFNKRDWNFNDWQEVIKNNINVKTKMTY